MRTATQLGEAGHSRSTQLPSAWGETRKSAYPKSRRFFSKGISYIEGSSLFGFHGKACRPSFKKLSCSVTLEKKGTLFGETGFLVGQPPKKRETIGATEQLSQETIATHAKKLFHGG